MLKFASKVFLEILFSVLATVIGPFLAHQYIASRPAANPPVSLADATAEPKRVDATAASREPVNAETAKADVTASDGPADVVNAIGPPAASPAADKTNDENAAPPVDKRAEPTTSAPARLHRSAPRNKRIAKTNAIAVPQVASLPSKEMGRDDSVSPSPGSEIREPHLAGRILKPIIRTALALFEPSSWGSHAHEPQRRTSPEVTERSSSERMRVADDVRSSRRPQTKTQAQWP